MSSVARQASEGAARLQPELGQTGPAATAGGLAGRLRSLRRRAGADCRNATLQVQLASGALLGFFGIGWIFALAGLYEALAANGPNSRYVAPEAWQIVLTVVVCLLTPGVMAYVLNTVLNAPRLSAWAYQDCLRGLVHRDYGLLFADEGLQLALLEIQQDHWTEALLPQAQATSLEAQLELAAQNFAAARLLPGGTEAQIRGQLVARRWRRRRDFFFRMPFWLRGLLLVLWPIGLPLGLLGIGTLTFLGPDFICARARLAAFIDHYFDEPKVQAGQFGPPEQTPTWWLQLTAPWRSGVRPGLR
jgi:hypothetical protein